MDYFLSFEWAKRNSTTVGPHSGKISLATNGKIHPTPMPLAGYK